MSNTESKSASAAAGQAIDPIGDGPLSKSMPRAILGGALMGMANLVPGISGGTMLLAAGIFPQFIQAVTDITRLRFRRNSIGILVAVVLAAAAVIGPLAGAIGRLVVGHTWVMYSLFIGLTFGGVPLIWKMLVEKTRPFWLGVAAGLLLMIAVSALQMQGVGEGGNGEAGIAIMFFAGVLGAGAMVLPGLSGGYLLLLMGVYVPILNGIESFYLAVLSMDLVAAIEPGWKIILPVGLGVLVGVAGVSNLIKVVLQRYQHSTLGVLLGLLLGAVIGLWPFQHGAEPAAGMVLKGQNVVQVEGQYIYQETNQVVDRKDYPREFFRPGAFHVTGAIGLIVLGFAVTSAVASYGDRRRPLSAPGKV